MTWNHQIYEWKPIKVEWDGEETTLLIKSRLSFNQHRILVTDTRNLYSQVMDLNSIMAKVPNCGIEISDDPDDLEFLSDSIELGLRSEDGKRRFHIDENSITLMLEKATSRGRIQWKFNLLPILNSERDEVISREITLPIATLAYSYRCHLEELLEIAKAKQKEVSELLILASKASISTSSRKCSTSDFNGKEFIRNMNEKLSSDFEPATSRLYQICSMDKTCELLHVIARRSRLPSVKLPLLNGDTMEQDEINTTPKIINEQLSQEGIDDQSLPKVRIQSSLPVSIKESGTFRNEYSLNEPRETLYSRNRTDKDKMEIISNSGSSTEGESTINLPNEIIPETQLEESPEIIPLSLSAPTPTSLSVSEVKPTTQEDFNEEMARRTQLEIRLEEERQKKARKRKKIF